MLVMRAQAEEDADVVQQRRERSWLLDIDGAGDLTMEVLAATARADMFVDTFGQELTIRRGGPQT